jgi:hypothetical protein
MTDLGDGRGQEAAVPADGAAALEALAECLRFLACGYGLDPRERAACLAILEAGIPGADPADLAAVTKLMQAPRSLAARARDQASALSIRLSATAETSRQQPPCDRVPE